MSAPVSIDAPNDLTTEVSVLGSIILDNKLLDTVTDYLRPEDFFRPVHAEVFRGMLSLAARKEHITTITLKADLEERGTLAEIGGPDRLDAVFLSVSEWTTPTGEERAAAHARRLRDVAQRRAIALAARQVWQEASSGEGAVDALCDRACKVIFDAAERRGQKGAEPAKAVIQRVYANLEKRYERQTDITGVRSGFEEIDLMTAGWQPGDFIVLGARPAMGKTGLMMAMAHAAAKEGAVLVCEQEMSSDQLVERQLASLGLIPASRVKSGKFLDDDWRPLARASSEIHRSDMHFVDEPRQTVMSIRSHARRLKRKRGKLAGIFVDYLQLMDGEGENREQKIGNISRGLKELAREMECPLIALSQLNRSLERREDKRPVMSDIRDSGSVEQDADTIVFLYRDEVYNQKTNDKGIAELIFGKQRNGSVGTVRIRFRGEYVRFENLPDGENFRRDRSTWDGPRPPEED
jgi:replicative DNA helicase